MCEANDFKQTSVHTSNMLLHIIIQTVVNTGMAARPLFKTAK